MPRQRFSTQHTPLLFTRSPSWGPAVLLSHHLMCQGPYTCGRAQVGRSCRRLRPWTLLNRVQVTLLYRGQHAQHSSLLLLLAVAAPAEVQMMAAGCRQPPQQPQVLALPAVLQAQPRLLPQVVVKAAAEQRLFLAQQRQWLKPPQARALRALLLLLQAAAPCCLVATGSAAVAAAGDGRL